jgi:hypothetical protein
VLCDAGDIGSWESPWSRAFHSRASDAVGVYPDAV